MELMDREINCESAERHEHAALMKVALFAIAACAITFPLFAKKPTKVFPPTEIYNGQNYSDSVYFVITKPDYIALDVYYDLIEEQPFLDLIGTNRFFVFKWMMSTTDPKAGLYYFPSDISKGTDAWRAISREDMPIYTSCVKTDGRILKLFPESSINSGYVMGVVKSDLSGAYDLTDRIEWYRESGSIVSWDGESYVTDLQGNESPSYTVLDDRGAKMFREDLKYAKKWLSERDKTEEAVKERIEVIELTNTITKTETVVVPRVENVIVVITNTVKISETETYVVTNKTVIIDPISSELHSTLSISYPKVVTEGGVGIYSLDRTGSCGESLVVHVITNGYFCSNLSWGAGESGRKSVKITYPITEEFNDSESFEVMVKTINRKTGTK